MKKVALILFVCFSFGILSAQESIKLQNAGNDALKAKDYATALGNYEKAISDVLQLRYLCRAGKGF
jgi:hypothetical protein